MRNKTSARSRRSPLHLERLKLKYDSHPLTCNFAPAFERTHNAKTHDKTTSVNKHVKSINEMLLTIVRNNTMDDAS